MTMLSEIEQQIAQYQPTVQDKIQRVLYRLDHGEQLGQGTLLSHNRFCIMGLFTDESGLGYWDTNSDLSRTGYVVDPILNYPVYIFPPKEVINYYGFKDEVGSFRLADLPESLRNEIKSKIYPEVNGYNERVPDVESMVTLNDSLLFNPEHTKEYVNSILAKIIRSEAIFN